MEGFDGKGAADFEFAIGSVRGLRTWDLPASDVLQRSLAQPSAEMPSVEGLTGSMRGGPLLRGMTGKAWEPGVNEAKCSHHPDHEPPVEFDAKRDLECGCGFWAYWQLDPGRRWNGSLPVMGIIEGTGRVLIGEKGFRSQKARIIALVPVFRVEASRQESYGWGDRSYSGWRSQPDNPADQEQHARELAEAQSTAAAWMGVIMEALGTMYPEARIFATVRGMLASIPTGEITS
jgi:hypothetical protein